MFDKKKQDGKLARLLRLFKEQNAFSDPGDELSQMVRQVLGEETPGKDLLDDEELYHIQAAAGQPDCIKPERDKDR